MAHATALKGALSALRNTVLPVEAQQVEHVLRVARVALAAGSLLAIRLVVGASGGGARIALLAGLVYLGYSLLLLFGVKNVVSRWWPFGVHAVDVLWAASLPVLTGNPYVPFSVFFVFTLFAAAYRWGFWRTLATVGSTIVLLIAGTVVPNLAGTRAGPWSMPDNLPARSIGWILMGCLVGFLGESQSVLRGRAVAATRLLAGGAGEGETSQTLEDLLGEMLDLFVAQGVTLVLEDASTSGAYIWQSSRDPRDGEVGFESSELNAMEREMYLFPGPGDAWYAAQSRWTPGHPTRLTVLDQEGRRRYGASLCSAGVLVLEGCSSYYAAAVRPGAQWGGRVFLFDPIGGVDREAELRLVQSLARELVSSARRFWSPETPCGEREAAVNGGLARELHDGIIQTLAAVEMRMEALRRQGSVAPQVAEELEHIRDLVHQEVVGMRDLVYELRSRGLRPSHLADALRATVSGFEKETGIRATFASQGEEVRLSPAACREVVQILREALVNVRKHSGAHQVAVRFEQQNGSCKLLVDDDGRGFAFAGQRSLAELEASDQGPWAIKERIRVIRGDLIVESRPGRGARLEVTIPQEAYD